ncbi:MAG: hypothetical protein SFX19_02775 [Alphaproteobacteria bacterium]|nr:hypothetical protein [Alphaproteobacteria bacterium]
MSLSPQEKNELNTHRRQALELLEWTMDDISPEGKKLHIKCGVERELHYIDPNYFMPHYRDNGTFNEKLSETLEREMERIAGELQKNLPYNELLERIYHDTAGTFLVETVTLPLTLGVAAKATEDSTAAILEIAKKKGHYCGTYLDLDNHMHLSNHFKYYPQEVFQIGSRAFRLVGRGQHANVSLWCDDKNLFSTTPALFDNCAHGAAALLSHFILPSRSGNYHRIKAKSINSILTITSNTLAKGHGNAIRVVSPDEALLEVDNINSPSRLERCRLEFRQAAAEANPYDVVLAAALPLVKTCIDTLPFDPTSGKLADTQTFKEYAEPEAMPMPRSEQEAAALFNTADNPYFIFLNELAERKLQRLTAMRSSSDDSAALRQEIRDASSLLGIGTKMHHLYCRQYGMESVMPLQTPMMGVV